MPCCCRTLVRPKVESICRWTLFGLTCLSWLFVVSSTGTCSFIVDTTLNYDVLYYTRDFGLYYKTDYGLFCLKGNGVTFRYSDIGYDLPRALVTARLFGTVACLTITATLIAISLVIFVFPNTTVHAVRAWWTTRILCAVSLVCVLLTFTMNTDSFCPACHVSTGSILNALNVLLLILLIVLSFWIQVTGQPVLSGLGNNSDLGNTTKDLSSETEMPEHSKDSDNDKQTVVSTISTPTPIPHIDEVTPNVQ